MNKIYAYCTGNLLESPTLRSSLLNNEITNKWLQLQQTNVFNYKLVIENDKVLEGNFGFYVQVSLFSFVMKSTFQ